MVFLCRNSQNIIEKLHHFIIFRKFTLLKTNTNMVNLDLSKMMRKKLFLYTSLFLILLQSCAGSAKKAFKNEFKKTTQENYSELNGVYYNHPKKVYDKKHKSDISESELLEKNIYAILNFRPYTVNPITLREEEEKIELTFITNQQVKVNYVVNGEIKASSILTGKIKKGYFYLDPKNSESWGIPILHGGYTKHKRKIGMSKQGNLIVDAELDASSSFFFFFANGFQNITTYEVEKIR